MTQCKDIPDLPILKFLAKLSRQEIVYSYENCGRTESFRPTRACVFEEPSYSVQRAMPPEAQGQDKLVRAKMGMLIRRGLVTGCTCGCRGDFELTEKGRAFLDSLKPCERGEIMCFVPRPGCPGGPSET